MGDARLHLTGGDGFGWALDEDIETFRRALPPQVELVGLKDADIVYSPWWRGLAHLGSSVLLGKRVLCGFDNPLFHWIMQPEFRGMVQLVGLWVAHTDEALEQSRVLGLKCGFVPYTLRTEIFHPPDPRSFDRCALRGRLGLPPDAYVIGNFQRDSEGFDLTVPKLQKGPDVFAEIVRELKQAGCPVHVLLAGPRRHWLRARLAKYEVPFTYIGKEIDGDDLKVNLLARPVLNELYHALDLYLLTSRWEGGPYAVLEAVGTRCPTLSTPCGIAGSLLEPESLFTNIAEAVRRIKDDIAHRTLARAVDPHYRSLERKHTSAASRDLVASLIADAMKTAPFAGLPKQAEHVVPRRSGNSLRERASRLVRRLGRRETRDSQLAVSIFREYVKPPYGGGNQFMLALRNAFMRRGVRVLTNQVGGAIDGYVFDSLWFNHKLLDKLARLNRPRVAHRIDGPIHLYRGKDKELDDRIFEINKLFATTTVVQSLFTLERLFSIGYRPVNPVVVHNGSDSTIFNREGRISFDTGRKVRLISTSWSNNPRKGGDVYKWLDDKLDWSRYSYSFVGRTSVDFKHLQKFDAVPSEALATHLKANDIYITASQNDPCSNALIEALSCGLPAIYLRSGGHPELVGMGGLGFDEPEEIPALLECLVDQYLSFQSCIQVQSVDHVAEAYLACATTG